ncbi:MAG: hydrogen peroxide-inducible genes activator [Leptospiraceae bacterium]|nr:hydrogen peroxide-inducible genes activator [Leptospiraceae bacterium]
MTLVQLKYAVVLDKIKNFAQAAQVLYIAQPTLSLQIQKLEKELGIQIFDRTTNPISVTAEGKELIKQAKIVLQEAEKLEYMFKEGNGVLSGEIQLGIIPTISSSLLVKLLPVLQEKYTNLKVKIYELPTAQIIQKLESKELDIGILATPLHNKKIIEKPIYYEPFLIYLPPSFKTKKDKISLEELEGYEMILLGDEHCFRGQTLKLCRQSGFGNIEAGSFETIKKLVDKDLGVTLLPFFEEVNFQERLREIKGNIPAREVSFVTSQFFYKNEVLQALKKEILQIIPKEYHSGRSFQIIGVDSV